MHQPYYRAPTSMRFLDQPTPDAPKRGKAKKRRATRQVAPFPLTVLAELLGCHAATPYGAAKKFRLAVWVRSRVREQLTVGAGYAVGVEMERAVRFRRAELERHARFVLALRADHQGKPLDGVALATALEMPSWRSGPDFKVVWLTYVGALAEELVGMCRLGNLEDLPRRKAEAYLDQTVAPRVRSLRRVDPDAESPLPNRFGGLRRTWRIVNGLTSANPEVVTATLRSWEVERLNWLDAPDPSGWEEWGDEADRPRTQPSDAIDGACATERRR